MKSKVVYCSGTEFSRSFDSASDAAEELGISKGSISKSIKGKRKVKGLSFRYAPRIYLAKLAGGQWVACTYNPVSKRCIGLNSQEPLEGVRMLRDVTRDFYGKEVEL